jgi:hypothetical protein
MKLLRLIIIALTFTPITSIASPYLEKIKSLGTFAGRAEYCQLYYESKNKPFKAAIMGDYNKRISMKLSDLYKSQHQVNVSNRHRQQHKLFMQKYTKKRLKKSCINLNNKLKSLKLD